MPYRALIDLPVAAAILPLFATEVAWEKTRRWLFLPLATLVIIQFSAMNNRQYYAGHWALERDKLIGAEIIENVRRMAPESKNYAIAVIGAGPRYDDPTVPNWRNTTVGSSFFEWDGGNPQRIARFLSIISGVEFYPAAPEMLEKAFESAGHMSVWPEAGSIVQRDGIFIIKLSEPTRQQIHIFCAQRQSDFCFRRN